MTLPRSLQHKIIRLFMLFTLALSLVYSLLLLGYSWVVEDNIFNRLVANEASYIIDYYDKNKKITAPRLEFIRLYRKWQDLPGDIYQLHQSNPDQIEFDLPNGGSMHVKTLTLGQQKWILAADVTGFEVSKDYLPFTSFWLIIIILLISGCALLVSLMVSRSAINPLKRLTEKVANSKNAPIDDAFAAEFEQNEVGYLAQTFATSIAHLQKVLLRESDFTRDVSHELRTPITILKNLAVKLKQQPTLNDKDSRQFHFAISQMQQTVITLLALAREESMAVQELPFLTILEECVINHYELNQHEQFELNITIASDFTVVANENLLKILINNLLTNAVNYATGGQLTIKTVGSDLYFENESRDFEVNQPFAANSKGENSQGIGLGLNLVERVCTLFNWKVSLMTQTDAFRLVISTLSH